MKGQLNNDAQATHELLVALEHQGRVQAVSSSIGLFFVADRDRLRVGAVASADSSDSWYQWLLPPVIEPGTGNGKSCFLNLLVDTDREIIYKCWIFISSTPPVGVFLPRFQTTPVPYPGYQGLLTRQVGFQNIPVLRGICV